MEANRWLDRGWIVLWGLVSSVWCLTAATHLSATFDEPHYLKHGLHAWRTGSYQQLLRAGTMPLPVDVEMFPVFIAEQVRGRPFSLETEFAIILQIARAGNLVFWWMLLYFSWRLGRRFGGVWAGRLAVPLIACEPNFLAHASLATTDIAISACMAMFAEFYLAGRKRVWLARVGIPALCFGTALLAKASALAFGGIVMGAFELHRLWQQPKMVQFRSFGLLAWLKEFRRETVAFRWDAVQIVLLGIVWAFVYCGSDWRTDQGLVNSLSKLPSGFPRDAMLVLAEHLRVFPNAGQGLAYQVQHNFRGHGTYVLGDWFPRAVWYYFPVALTMKLTIPVLLMLVGVLVGRPRSFAHPLGLLVAILLLFTINCRVQIGIRLILPFLTFLLVALAVALVRSLPDRAPDWSRRLSFGTVCLLPLVPMLLIWPHGLCYFNEFWGGSKSGYRYLSDSNYDWGQGLDDLTGWREQHNQPAMKIWYYGADPRIVGEKEYAPLHNYDLQSEEDFERHVRGHYLAVGATNLYSNPAQTPSAAQALAVIKGKKPIARTMTFFIYDFTEPRAVVSVP